MCECGRDLISFEERKKERKNEGGKNNGRKKEGKKRRERKFETDSQSQKDTRYTCPLREEDRVGAVDE